MAREDAFLWCEAIAVFTLAISLLAPMPARADVRSISGNANIFGAGHGVAPDPGGGGGTAASFSSTN